CRRAGNGYQRARERCGGLCKFSGDRLRLCRAKNHLGILFGANLRHSHVHLSYGRRLEGIFISPYQHQLHHSIAAADKNCNYGVALALWDRLGGTLIRGRPVVKLYYGLVDEAPRFGDIKAHYGHPIKSFFQKRS
ncbi:MAG: sterol desaturase family protein, partial [Rhodospirillaceae bacterium]